MRKHEVKILADSINYYGDRLTTFQLSYWRPIHAEVLTHRVFSKNAGSSRARPTRKQVEDIRKEPWGPLYWGLNQRGMDEDHQHEDLEKCEARWRIAANAACDQAEFMLDLNLHKGKVNRVLEPYNKIDVVLTSSFFENFFDLRISDNAYPEIRMLAEDMKKAKDESDPRVMGMEGFVHLPYILEEDRGVVGDLEKLKLISAARCARVSYKLFDGTTNYDKDLKLAHRLIQDMHWSPFEHVASATMIADEKQSRNFGLGWIQFRHEMGG